MASSSSPKIHLYKKSAIEAGTPGDYYLDPSDNLMKIRSAWGIVEHEDYLVLSVDLFAIGDLVLLGPEPEEYEIQIVVALENKEKAARFKHRDGMKVFRIKMNPKFIKKINTKDDATYKVLPEDSSKLARVMIYKLKLKESAVMASSSSPKIHLFKKSAIEAGTPEDYYLDPSDNLMKIAFMWSVVEHEDDLVLSINMVLIGDLVFIEVDGEKNIINIEVDVENKRKAARFHHEDGMKNFSIVMNPKFLKLDLNSDPSPYSVSEDHGGTTNLLITKLKLKKELSAGRISDLDLGPPEPESTAKLLKNKLKLKKESSAGRISDLD
ncbi:hypothetical protein C5167_002498 [Papaver somniferum]|uniref:Uncharacterized protein n=1 Tax=Papaver somniferum TaxID=3469 RepID=A0A4Y7L0W6_PAPSO|nr:uncharacterized protein LOC113309595 [Papaver somniferum]XP_026413832.1 uncharacterized protein LOC113309595 [Papaver somniferum]RZC78292.1 hypothetical protein C5167_002498 [Papaver somniferum]